MALSAACARSSFSKSLLKRGYNIEAAIIIWPTTGMALSRAVPNNFAPLPATLKPNVNLFSAPVAFATSFDCLPTEAAAILKPSKGPAPSIILKAAAVLRDVELMPFALPRAPEEAPLLPSAAAVASISALKALTEFSSACFCARFSFVVFLIAAVLSLSD